MVFILLCLCRRSVQMTRKRRGERLVAAALANAETTDSPPLKKTADAAATTADQCENEAEGSLGMYYNAYIIIIVMQ